jgi:integrase
MALVQWSYDNTQPRLGRAGRSRSHDQNIGQRYQRRKRQPDARHRAIASRLNQVRADGGCETAHYCGANVKAGVHILRHTFCSHLAMRGAPARAIQELAGHQDLDTTQRYMHLSPAALDAAIRLLDGPAEAGPHNRSSRGEILEAAGNQH